VTTLTPRQMRLTAEHVAKLAREIADPGHPTIAGFRPATDADYVAAIDAILAGAPEGDFWVFAYGSLMWRPAFDNVEQRPAVAAGWHRAFCLGWDRRFRGNAERPGLMLALDRGGVCKGVVYRLPPDAVRPNLDTLVHREMSMVPSAFPPRFVKVATETGPLRALTFAINRRSGRYISGLSNEEIADVLSAAVGFRGSMAEYLFSTVRHLEDLGIHDKHLWELQELVAQRIEAANGMPPA
jgi:glutathione-specific gamma-glutamylcyclotransferase